ncbi:MAG: hypothetical protein OXP73_09920 [Chloroflexota bacterium]|nr:hypothetical protein [Chloroflexota bacterium]
MALGLWASLVPQVTFPSASAGELSNDVQIVWPGWGVQQDLGDLSGSVGRFQIWASAQAHGPEVSVHATLIDASTREVVRDKSIVITPSYIPVMRTLTFPSYVVPENQRLLLQLQVADFEEHIVVFRLAVPRDGLANLEVNGVPDSASGPMAFVHLETGSGLRAAIRGESSERIRLALAVGLSALLVLAHSLLIARLRRAGALARRITSDGRTGPSGSPGIIGRLLANPWYPWPAVAIPILHFLANNDIHFTVSEAAVPLIVALVVVSLSVIALRLLLKDFNRAALVTTVVVLIFFAYGHAERALDARVDERLFFAGAVVVGAAVAVHAARSRWPNAGHAQFLNVVAGTLLVFQATSLASGAVSTLGFSANAVTVDELTAHLFPSDMPVATDDRPDIYYIILDAYGRYDSLVDFDNSEFLRKLEARGFYIASESTSNYVSTPHSLASSLNMSYLHELGPRTPARHHDLMNLVYYNSLAAILKTLGYTYVHLESGHQFTSKAPLADIFASFGPSGIRVVSNQEHLSDAVNPFVSRIFVRELIRTTVLRPVLQGWFLTGDEDTYNWWSPHRALDMFEFLSDPLDVDGPKFVFAHISKPKVPATFDRHGNYVLGNLVEHEFSDTHDPSVPDAYAGQLIYINHLMINLIDDILRNQDSDPIIVIAGDHNRRGTGKPLHPILAAFRLPDDARQGLYPSISSVNHFRHILRAQFGLDIDIIEDRTILHSGVHWDFTSSAKGRES